jgi:hypothetical protein
VIPALRKLRKEAHELEASLHRRPCLSLSLSLSRCFQMKFFLKVGNWRGNPEDHIILEFIRVNSKSSDFKGFRHERTFTF